MMSHPKCLLEVLEDERDDASEVDDEVELVPHRPEVVVQLPLHRRRGLGRHLVSMQIVLGYDRR